LFEGKNGMGWLRLVGSLGLQVSFAKETCHFKEPTNRSHPIAIKRGAQVVCVCVCLCVCVCERARERERVLLCGKYGA